MNCFVQAGNFCTVCSTCGEGLRSASRRTVARKKPLHWQWRWPWRARTPRPDFDVAVGELDALDDLRERADGVVSSLRSSTEASCCVDRKSFCRQPGPFKRTDASLRGPTMNGVICCGKITMSRTGIIGSASVLFHDLNIRTLKISTATPRGPLKWKGFSQPFPANSN